MKRKPASRRPQSTKKEAPVVVGVKLAAPPTPKQLAALKKAFRTKALATVGIGQRAGVSKMAWRARKRRR